MYLYLAARSVPEKQLVEAECLALTGGLPDELGVVLTDTEADVSRAAYIKSCVRVILHAADLEDLYAQLEKLGLDSEGFRVSVVKLPRRLTIDSQQVMHQVGARIGGKPNLSDPKTVFVVVATEREFWLGELMSEATGSWNEHSQKTHLYSSALPTRFARAMVNLIASPGDTIIDPCCGSGTILIEAASMGIRVAGADNNPKMVTATIENLEHFGFSGLVMIADATNIAGQFDAVVTDLPYGRNCPTDEQLCRRILQNLKNLAPKAAIVTGEDVSDLLAQIGYEVKQVIAVPKGGLIRYVHVVSDNSALTH